MCTFPWFACARGQAKARPFADLWSPAERSMRSCVSRRAGARVSRLSGRLKDLPTVPATSILHQAAPEENGWGPFSLEAPFKGHHYAVRCRLQNQEILQLGTGIRVC
jgi:hypothetical protein